MGGSARACTPPIMKMGAKPLFCPPIIRREFFIFVILKEKTWKKAETETKKEKYKEKGVDFERKESIFEKVVDD